MTDLRLVVFDVDGTLVDSQGHIMAAMEAAFAANNLPAPERAAVLALVGLSLDVLMPRLAPDQSADMHRSLIEGYKDAFMLARSKQLQPLFAGASQTIESLNAQPEVLLGLATGKSRRGLDKVLDGHGLGHHFVTQQVADHHPSKPHPSMLHACMAETGVAQAQAGMVGDTSFDMEMAKTAGLFAIGVSWGYHTKRELAAADLVIDHFDELHTALKDYWG